jgi:predicted nucleic-acid-binding protein
VATADTNVLIRLLTNDEPAQARAALRLIDQQGPLRVPQIALVEAVWVLESTYRLPKGDVVQVLDRVLAGAEFICEREGEVEDALALFRASKADFSDCLLLAGARASGELPMATFDKALGRLAGALLLK